jgi:hypothetical protein
MVALLILLLSWLVMMASVWLEPAPLSGVQLLLVHVLLADGSHQSLYHLKNKEIRLKHQKTMFIK